MDGLAGVGDQDMLARGRWASEKSLRRYRRVAHYLRALNELDRNQLALAHPSVPTILRLVKKSLAAEPRHE